MGNPFSKRYRLSRLLQNMYFGPVFIGRNNKRAITRHAIT